MAGTFYYCIFGLRVRSAIELPELVCSDRHVDVDVVISIGSVASISEGDWVSSEADGSIILDVADVGRFAILDGTSIIVDPKPCIPLRNIRLFLLGSAFGALLHQRRLLPLHANAVEIDGAAVAFMGRSGAGKSTLAAWFHDHGLKLVADDVSVVTSLGERLQVLPGLPRLRLWRNALKWSGRRPENFEQSFSGDEAIDKFDVTIPTQSLVSCQTPLAAVYLLDSGKQFSAERLEGIDALDALFANTYRGLFLQHTGTAESHLRTCCNLVKAIPVYRLTRRWDLSVMDEDNRLILDHSQRTIRRIVRSEGKEANSRTAEDV